MRVARVRVHGCTVVCVAGFNIFDFAMEWMEWVRDINLLSTSEPQKSGKK